MRNNFLSFFFIIKFIVLSPVILFSATTNVELMKQKWPFDGIFGRFDESSLQRGFQVYREVCAACHGIRHISYRDLKGIGYTNDEIKVIAADYEVMDGPNDDGEMFEREARPSDKFVGPYENDKIARLANNGAYPPDLSLIVKARADGANYMYSLLNGYKEFPDNFEASEGMYYNEFYPGNQIAMPSPLMDDIVEYSDGTEATQSQIAKDVTSFLAWTAEPELEERHRTGVKVIIYLILLTTLVYLSMKKIWSRVDTEV